MTIANVTENAILELTYRATSWAGYAINATTTAQTNIGFSLHTADPTDTGTATTSETTYTGYVRVNVARSSVGFTAVVTDSGIATAAAVTFTAGTAGTGIISFFATAASNASPPTGAQNLLWSGTVSPVINSGSGVTPQLSPVNIQLD
jgi:hypothetical protein